MKLLSKRVCKSFRSSFVEVIVDIDVLRSVSYMRPMVHKTDIEHAYRMEAYVTKFIDDCPYPVSVCSNVMSFDVSNDVKVSIANLEMI